jgi:hypothetical protein
MQHRRPLFSLALFFTISACGGGPVPDVDRSGRQASAIIGGSKAVEADYPAVGTLLFTATDPYFGSEVGGMLCTGTLIAPDVVLLASHCIDPEPIFGPGVTPTWHFSFALDVTDFGSTTMTLPARTYEVKTALMNPQYSAAAFDRFSGGLGDFYDVALLFLKTSVTDRQPAVVLGPNDDDAVVVNASVKIVGYGIRVANYDPDNLSPDDTGIKYLAASIINEVGSTEMQIGNAAPTPQKCHGDSGGPTFLTFTDTAQPAERLIGVTSHAYDQTDCYKGGVDTRLDPYRTWIDTEMKKACTNGVRTSCTGGGALAVPTVPPAASNTSTDYVNSRTRDERCSATGPSSFASVLAVASLLGLSRRRARRG